MIAPVNKQAPYISEQIGDSLPDTEQATENRAECTNQEKPSAGKSKGFFQAFSQRDQQPGTLSFYFYGAANDNHRDAK